MAKLDFTPLARDDIREAHKWYEHRSVGLGERFLGHVEECLNRIVRNPNAYAIVHKQYRRAIVRKFPYVIFYRAETSMITVHAVFHSAQDPRKWRRRLAP